MKNKQFFSALSLLVVLFSNAGTSQTGNSEIKIPLYRTIDNKPFGMAAFYCTVVSPDAIPAENIPDWITNYQIQVVDMHPLQNLHDRMLDKKMTRKDSMNIKHIDVSKLGKRKTSHYAYILSAIVGDRKIVIADVNSNKDFRDDHVYKFDIPQANTKRPDAYETAPSIILNYEFFDGKKYLLKSFQAKILPFPDNVKIKEATSPDNYLDVIIIGDEIRKGSFTDLDGHLYHVAVTPYLTLDQYDYFWFQIKPAEEKYKDIYRPDEFQRENDFVVLGEKRHYKIKLTSPFADSLILIPVNDKSDKVEGSKEGMYFPSNIVSTKLDGTLGKLSHDSGKYLLLDFWGTWCAPCVAELPKLKLLQQKMKDKLNVISIALLIDADTAVLKDFVQREEMEWAHFYETGGGDKSFIYNFKVIAYPTYILIAPDGKIVIRSDLGEKGLEAIEEMLNSK